MPTPISPILSELASRLAGNEPIALFENNLDADGLTRVFSQPVGMLLAWDGPTVASALAAIEAANEAGEWITLAADYELGYALEPSLAARLPQTGRPLLQAWRWLRCDVLDRPTTDALVADALALLKDDEAQAGLGELQFGLDERAYRAALERIRQLIGLGDCYQVNFTFPVRARSYGHPLALYDRLRTAQPVRHGGYLRHAEGTILSRSPELFVAREGKRLVTRPMKGTAPLGQAQALAESVKDRAENLMIVDLLRNDLGRLAPKGGVRVERLFEIEDYATLHQMTSTVVAAPVSAGLGEVFGALYPCGSVTGAPKIRAMEIIRELEAAPRGLYCGALGWLAPDRSFSLNVPIRTMELNQHGDAHMGIGSGIVADSDAAAEWAECHVKARFATQLKPEFALFETLRCDGGKHPFPLLEQHLTRLGRSASALGFSFDAGSARVLLARTAADLSDEGPHRVRLALSSDGALAITHARLDPLPAHPTVRLAPERLRADDYLLRHKTTRRTLYDSALQQAIADGHFDALFFNEAGELCEGARSNIFLKIGGQLLTPPLACGLLPGVMRQTLLEAGQAAEARLYRRDLLRAEAIYVSNALRGLLAVSLVE